MLNKALNCGLLFNHPDKTVYNNIAIFGISLMVSLMHGLGLAVKTIALKV